MNCLFAVLACGLLGTSAAGVVKRSDDPSPLEALVQQQASAIQKLDTELTALKTQVASNSKKAAFTVQFSADPVVNVGVHANLKFDHVITNIGNGYDPQTGAFTAPVSGLYVLVLRAMSIGDGGTILLAVHKSDSEVAQLFVRGHTGPEDQGSTEVVVHVQAGEKVFVMHAAHSTSVRGSWWTVFTGYLLQAD